MTTEHAQLSRHAPIAKAIDYMLTRWGTTVATARSLNDRFGDMVRTGCAEDLPDWLSEAELSPQAPFTRGLRSDVTAVTAALRETWSNGHTEGKINRLKTLKRQIPGRARIDLLRAGVVAPRKGCTKSESEPRLNAD